MILLNIKAQKKIKTKKPLVGGAETVDIPSMSPLNGDEEEVQKGEGILTPNKLLIN